MTSTSSTPYVKYYPKKAVLVEQAAAAAESQEEQARSLKATVGGFKLHCDSRRLNGFSNAVLEQKETPHASAKTDVHKSRPTAKPKPQPLLQPADNEEREEF